MDPEDKLMERRASTSSIATEDSGYSSVFRTLNSIRVYSSQHEYLIAMIEDLSAWLEKNHSIAIAVENFFDILETGVILCRQAILVQNAGEKHFKELNKNSNLCRTLPKKYSNCYLTLPEQPPKFTNRKTTQRFIARDNIANFIHWQRQFGFSECLMFETEDLISRKNLRNVVLSLLELARVGGAFGLDVPHLVEMELEIDAEMELEHNYADGDDDNEEEEVEQAEVDVSQNQISRDNHNIASTTEPAKSTKPEKIHRIPRIISKTPVSTSNLCNQSNTTINGDQQEVTSCQQQPQHKNVIQLKPYQANCDIKSLDELVRDILLECECESIFPMTRLAEGKYLFGEKEMLIFVRVLRNHVMVRVGGGWDTLNHLLHKFDPCRKDKPQGTRQLSNDIPAKDETDEAQLTPRNHSVATPSIPSSHQHPSNHKQLSSSSVASSSLQTPRLSINCQTPFTPSPSHFTQLNMESTDVLYSQSSSIEDCNSIYCTLPRKLSVASISPLSTNSNKTALPKRRHSLTNQNFPSPNSTKYLSPLIKGSKIPVLQSPQLNVIKEHNSSKKVKVPVVGINSAPSSPQVSPRHQIKSTTKVAS